MANFAVAGAVHVVQDTPNAVANMFLNPSGVGIFSPTASAMETYYFGMFPHSFSDGYTAQYKAVSGDYRSEPMMYQWTGGEWSRFTLDLFVSNGVDGLADMDNRRSPDVIHHDVIRSAQEGVSSLAAFRQSQLEAVEKRVSFIEPQAPRETDVNKALPSVKEKVLWLQSLALPATGNSWTHGSAATRAATTVLSAFGSDTKLTTTYATPSRVVVTAGSWLLKTGYIESAEVTYLAPFDCEEYVAYDEGAVFTMGSTYEPLYAEVRLTLIQHGKYWYSKDAAGPTRTDVLRMGIA